MKICALEELKEVMVCLRRKTNHGTVETRASVTNPEPLLKQKSQGALCPGCGK